MNTVYPPKCTEALNTISPPPLLGGMFSKDNYACVVRLGSFQHSVSDKLVLVSLSSSFPGLLLSYKSQKQAFISYTYALTPLSDSPSRVDWKILTAEGLECQHIRYHQLQPGDSLNSLATKYKKLHAVSIVLANTEDSLQLAPEFKESAVKLKKGSLAVILISSEDGKSLREFLNRHDTGELYARIESKNMPQVELQSSIPPGVTYSPSPQPKSGAKHRGQCIYRSITLSCCCCCFFTVQIEFLLILTFTVVLLFLVP